MKPLKELTARDVIGFLKNVDKKTWIKVSLGVVFFIVLLKFVIYPAWIERLQIKMKMQAVRGQIQMVGVLNKKKPVWLKEKLECQNFIKETKKQLFLEEDVAFLLGEISKLAEESNVEVIASRPQENQEEFPEPYNQAYKPHSYDFTVEGGYHDLGRFLSKIESYPKHIRVQEFHIMPREKSPEKHIADLQVIVVSLHSREGKI